MVAWLAAVSALIWLLPCDGLAAESLELKFDGMVVARQFMQVAPQVNGAVSRILFVPGQRVAQGDVLFELDADVFKIDVSAAQSELDEARARLSLAADEAARQAQLMEHNATPVARAKQTAIEVEISRAAVARKQSALARAELALSHTRVVAPISGTVGRPHVAPGAFVDAKADTVLAEIAQLDPILVACYVSYVDRERFFKQAGTSSVPELFRRVTVSLELPSGRTYEHSGVPEFESAEIDRTTDMLTSWPPALSRALGQSAHNSPASRTLPKFESYGDARNGRIPWMEMTNALQQNLPYTRLVGGRFRGLVRTDHLVVSNFADTVRDASKHVHAHELAEQLR